MKKIALTFFVVAALALLLQGSGLAAQRLSSVGDETHSHEARDHAFAPGPVRDYLTLNVTVSDVGIQPSILFVPAGRPVQLLLRNRGTTEHHYRVLGLIPDDLAWVVQGSVAGARGGSTEAHDHHTRTLERARSASPAGIVPTGTEVHAYVSPAHGIDVVLFTATQTGTFLVQCDLHPEKVAKFTVFDPTSPHARTAISSKDRRMLTVALNRELGPVDYGGVSGVHVDATYATANYVAQSLGESATAAALEPERHIAFLLTERLHTATLPGETYPPTLFLNGQPVRLIDRKVMANAPHHRATFYRFARDRTFGNGHQMMTLRLSSGQEAIWHLPLVIGDARSGGPIGLGERWGLILALLGGMLAAMWPCLFQLTVYFIPALAGVAIEETGAAGGVRRRRVLHAAMFFILGFTLLYTATGALIGFAAQRLGDTGQFELWQRYFGVAAGLVVIALAVRVAAKARAPLVCRMPVLAWMGRSSKPAGRLEMMVAGLAFATGCMTCFGSALVVGMVVYIGLAQSTFYGALVLFLFSLGMGIPLVVAAVAMASALPLLLKLETAVPWMGLVSALIMAGFGLLLLSGNYMLIAEWSQRLVRN